MLEISLEIWRLWALFLVSLPLSGWKHWNFQPFQPFQHVSGCVSRISGSCKFFMTIYFFEFNHHLLVAKGESLNTKRRPQQNAVWVDFKGNFQNFLRYMRALRGNVVFPLEIPVESQGSPTGNRVVEINPSRAGNVRKGQPPPPLYQVRLPYGPF